MEAVSSAKSSAPRAERITVSSDNHCLDIAAVEVVQDEAPLESFSQRLLRNRLEAEFLAPFALVLASQDRLSFRECSRPKSALKFPLRTPLLRPCIHYTRHHSSAVLQIGSCRGCVATFRVAVWRCERIAKWKPDPRSSNGGRPNRASYFVRSGSIFAILFRCAMLRNCWRSVVAMSITQRYGAGYSVTALSLSSECEGILSPQTSLGEWTKPTFG
jgi:hypothetical protein